jgi:hypothetical protein
MKVRRAVVSWFPTWLQPEMEFQASLEAWLRGPLMKWSPTIQMIHACWPNRCPSRWIKWKLHSSKRSSKTFIRCSNSRCRAFWIVRGQSRSRTAGHRTSPWSKMILWNYLLKMIYHPHRWRSSSKGICRETIWWISITQLPTMQTSLTQTGR